MENVVIQEVNEDNVCLLSSAISELQDFISILESDGLNVKNAEDLWQILRSLIRFKVKIEFENHLGIWSTLKTSIV